MINRLLRTGMAVAAIAAHTYLLPPNAIISQAHAACDDSAVAGVDWQDCRKRNLIMTDFDFTGSNFSRADMSSSDLRGTTLVDVNFFKANLVRASLKGSKASLAEFGGVTASRTDFSESDLSGSNFEKSEIIRSNFTNSNLQNANMAKSDLFRAVFNGADLSGVDFSFSSLARADFRQAKLDENVSLKNAFLYLARIEGVDLSVVSDLKQWQIDMTCGSDETKLPDGIERPANWPCTETDED